jgi:hypothetical protein
MAKWYVKELSSLTGVSVQTLHHYDRVSLLKPSVRLDNGYRLYSEQDLAKLQKIIALKFFGFVGLSTAKKCMDMVNGLYGKENANLKHVIWNRGFKSGHMDREYFTSPKVVAWLDKAIDAYYRGRNNLQFGKENFTLQHLL